MIAFLIFAASVEYYLFPTHVVVNDKNKVVKVFETLNAEAQCKQYARWKGSKYECIKP